MMHFRLLQAAFSCLLSASAVVAGPIQGDQSSDFTNNVVFRPGPDYTSWGTIYGRSLQISDGSLLVTWENYPPEPPLMTFPIWKSDDGGVSWYSYRNVSDQVHGWGLRYQPHLYMLQNDIGDFPAGTIILSGMAVRPDLGEASLDVYVSTDDGSTWEFVSQVAYAPGPETVTNGNKAVWEPFFLEHDGRLICYYSDQRDESHAQKLVHVITDDLKQWSDLVDDEADPVYGHRPGMTTVARIGSTGNYIMTYEVCAGTEPGCPAYYKVAPSPLEFASVRGQLIRANATGEQPGSAPFVLWAETKCGSGVILVSGGQDDAVYVNDAAARADGWKRVDVGQQSSHSRCMEVIDFQGQKKLLLTSAGHMSSGADNYVSVGVVGIPAYS
ncbi:Sialidase [Plectosphaerella plurivora]|uniref:Sialidase n=1 Tax=Plectosphaerella plurivora TaxID=936078 RepID=A0A9P8VLH2_9PEZI|nr:Sialidase [Plectosphaerella plurivora]